MISYFNNWELDKLYDEVLEYRKTVKNNNSMMEYYNQLKDINKNDQLYGWIFVGDGIMNDHADDLNMYQTGYIRDILTVYKNELQNIILKNNL